MMKEEGSAIGQGKSKKTEQVKVGHHAVTCRSCSISENDNDLSFLTVENSVTSSSGSYSVF